MRRERAAHWLDPYIRTALSYSTVLISGFNKDSRDSFERDEFVGHLL